MLSAEKRDTWKEDKQKKISDFTDLLQTKNMSISLGKKEHSKDTEFSEVAGETNSSWVKKMCITWLYYNERVKNRSSRECEKKGA